jgi:hypothetical protein
MRLLIWIQLTALFTFIFLPFVLTAQQGKMVNYYIAPTGSASNPGTIDKPFQSPAQAWSAIQSINGPAEINVYIRGGHYSFSKSLVLSQSGNDSSRHVNFSAYKDEKVFFTGGVKLDNSKFVPTTDPNILNRLPASARGKVYEISLASSGISDYGREQPHGYNTIHAATLELFFNEKPLPVAKYPNQGLLPVGEVLDPGSTPRKGEKPDRGAKILLQDPHISKWKQADDAWVYGYFSYGYSDDHLKIDTIDPAAKTIRLKWPSLYSVFSTDNTSDDALKNAQKIRGYYVYNLIEELDSPGEWYLDRTSGKLYVWPPDNSLPGADIEVSMLQDPVVVLSGVRNVGFKGIKIECSRGIGMLLLNTTGTIIDHCTFDGLGTVGISTGDQLDGRISYPGATGNSGYNRNMLIQDCEIANTGTGGILLDGGDRKSLTPAGNIVNNCNIYNFSRIVRTYTPAVSLHGVGNMVTHCDIHDAPDQAILFSGNDHIIAYNHIWNVVSYMSDAGAVYTGRDLGAAGNVISYNFFDNLQSAADVSTCAIYLDDGASGVEVDGNVFYKSGTAGKYNFGAVHINGGSDNKFRNNYFVDCHLAFSNSVWKDQQWRSFIGDAGVAKQYRPGVDMRSAAFAKYGHLSRLTDTSSATPQRMNYTFNTLTYNTPVLGSTANLTHRNQLVASQDPGFTDISKKNFTLNKTPASLQQASDWKPAPFAQMGRQLNP